MLNIYSPSRLSGTITPYVSYLENSGLASVVPRMEAQYLNPSPWAENENYEKEFYDVLKQVRSSFYSKKWGVKFLLCCKPLFLKSEFEKHFSKLDFDRRFYLPGVIFDIVHYSLAFFAVHVRFSFHSRSVTTSAQTSSWPVCSSSPTCSVSPMTLKLCWRKRIWTR